MSQFYKEKNTETSFELFNKRNVYKSDMLSQQNPHIVDFISEKILYGRVNRIFVPIEIKSEKNLKRLGSRTEDFKALNFVADAFSDLQKQFDKCRTINKITADDPYLSTLKVFKAYESPKIKFSNYSKNLLQLYKNVSAIDTNKMLDFNVFSENILEIIKKNGKINPITYPAFIKSTKNSINSSGLVIEIADLDFADDDNKIDLFKNSLNWNFYVNACKTYGFMIDSDAPWRLVADIGSQAMMQYASRYNINSTNEVIFRYYSHASSYYYNNFINIMLNSYNSIIPQITTQVQVCREKTNVKYTRPQQYADSNKLKESYGQDKFIELYCKLRFYEEESKYDDSQIKIIIGDVIQLSKITNESKAISEFEVFLNKTFDYQGSLGYYIRQQEAIKQT